MKMLRSFAIATALTVAIGCGGGGGVKPGGTGGGAGSSGSSGSSGSPGAAGAQGTGGAGGSAGGQGGGAGVTLVGWVDDLAEVHTNATDAPDTVEDKVGVIIDTDDPAAFDPLLNKQAP